LPAAPVDAALFKLCQPLVITDDTLEPRYRRGETILVAPFDLGYRKGDDVLIERHDGEHLIGRLLFEDRDNVVVKNPSEQRTATSKAIISAVRRIAFVVL
jgi:phage repressor protein C with HTH and peptisase S24 domain